MILPASRSVWVLLLLLLAAATAFLPVVRADDPPADAAAAAEKKPAAPEEQPEAILEGHSNHGEVFNEGPRQAATLIDGVGEVHFEVTTQSEEARAFVLQGIAQLHGFWYFESERSFRQAAMLDPDCAIAYWGMAMSNRKTSKRAQGFIKNAMDRKDKASKREQMYIEAFDEYINAKSETKEEKTKRATKYITRLDDLLIAHPEDLEAKAFLCEFLWSARRDGFDMPSYVAINSMIQDVLDKQPLHPIHHYRIHLWDGKKPENALESAANCGPAAPAIAHMWHMPGHIYSKLKRYHDAVYQQEASARVDHRHMMQDRVLPDQIHNFAHNNEWCIRNMIHIGRVSDAIELAKNMIQLPKHPKYNTSSSGSFKYGRERLLDVLRTFQLHDLIVQYGQSPWLAVSDGDKDGLKIRRYLASSYVALGNREKAETLKTQLQTELNAEQAKQKEAGDKAEKEAQEAKKDENEIAKARKTAEDKLKSSISDLQKAIQEIDGRLAVADGKLEEALELFKKAGGVPLEEQITMMLAAGKTEDAVKKIADHVRTNKNEVRLLAAQIEALWAAGQKDEAKAAFEKLREISSTIDLQIPVFQRLTPIATELGFDAKWTLPYATPDDLGARPKLASLGPFRWQPVAAPAWSLPDVENKTRSLDDYRGKPVVVIFYLGAGCLHCAEQLQKFAPKTEEFRKAGYEVVAISTDRQKVLGMASKDLEVGFPFPLVADHELNIFKKYRCYDDFEKQALHGTFVIDGGGRIRWQDISYEPFMDADFVLQEANRLLQQDQPVSEEATETSVTVTGAAQ